MTIPNICSNVHSFGKNAKLSNTVAAFRVVEVIDMVSAPNLLVIAQVQDPPNEPIVAKRHRAIILFDIVHFVAAKVLVFTSISCIVPGSIKKKIDSWCNLVCFKSS